MPNLENQEFHVEQANGLFYRAFESLDIRQMDSIWAKGRNVKCIHPGWELRSGWPSIRDSWVTIFNHTTGIRFELSDVDIAIQGDIAWISCIEHITTVNEGRPEVSRILATNIFVKDGKRWLMLHHHGSPIFIQRDQ